MNTGRTVGSTLGGATLGGSCNPNGVSTGCFEGFRCGTPNGLIGAGVRASVGVANDASSGLAGSVSNNAVASNDANNANDLKALKDYNKAKADYDAWYNTNKVALEANAKFTGGKAAYDAAVAKCANANS